MLIVVLVYIAFPDIDAVVAVLTSTKVKGTNIQVQTLELPYVEASASISLPCRLLLSGFCSVDIDHLGLLIERTVPLEYNTDFFLAVHNASVLMTLKQQLSEKGMCTCLQICVFN